VGPKAQTLDPVCLFSPERGKSLGLRDSDFEILVG